MAAFENIRQISHEEFCRLKSQGLIQMAIRPESIPGLLSHFPPWRDIFRKSCNAVGLFSFIGGAALISDEKLALGILLGSMLFVLPWLANCINVGEIQHRALNEADFFELIKYHNAAQFFIAVNR